MEDLEVQVKALVRLALSNCVEGNSYWQYERQAAGWALGYEQITGRTRGDIIPDPPLPKAIWFGQNF